MRPTVRFDELFDEAVPTVLAGGHGRDEPPVEGGRWPVTVVLLPDDALATRLHEVTLEAARLAGPGHWHTGAAGVSHLTVRALEGYRASVTVEDPAVARYARAMRRAAARCGPVGVEVTGLTLTPSTGPSSTGSQPVATSTWAVPSATRRTSSGPTTTRARPSPRCVRPSWHRSDSPGRDRDTPSGVAREPPRDRGSPPLPS